MDNSNTAEERHRSKRRSKAGAVRDATRTANNNPESDLKIYLLMPYDSLKPASVVIFFYDDFGFGLFCCCCALVR